MRSLFFLFLIGFCGCAKKQAKTERIFPVEVAEIVQKEVPRTIDAIGKLCASEEVAIKPQIDGLLTSVLFNNGQKVEENALLITIDCRPYEAALKAAQAALAEDQAKLRCARDFAKTYGSLVGKEYVSRLDCEQYTQDAAALEAKVEADLANIETAKINLSYTKIHSPILGYVGLRSFDRGNYVTPNDDRDLVTIRKVTPITVSFSVPCSHVCQIRAAQTENPLHFEALLPKYPNQPLVGEVTFIDNTVDPQTGMLLMQGTIPNEDERGWPGEFVHVKLLLETLPDAILCPTSAIKASQDGLFAFVLNEDMTVEMRKIATDFTHGDFTVISSGLALHERVITDGQINLSPGVKVFIPKEEKNEG